MLAVLANHIRPLLLPRQVLILTLAAYLALC